ncbi:PqqD family protein, partial [Paenibacillus terrae]
MNFIPYKTKKVFIRIENNDLTTLYSDRSGLRFLNSVSGYIFDNIDGINTFEDIVNSMKTLYPTVDEITLTNDTLNCLHSLKTMKFINWKDGSEMNTNTSISSLSVEVAGEQDYSIISKYILRNYKNNLNDNYLVN